MVKDKMRLVAVSNRLPVTLKQENGDWKASPSSGGLVTAMAPVLKNRGGLWVGWPGTSGKGGFDEALREASGEAGFHLHPVYLSDEDVEGYYYGFSNEVIWPLFHNFEARCNFLPEYWKKYEEVNRKFGEKVASLTGEKDYIWVHDYQLILLGSELRKLNTRSKLGFFLHIPFPPVDLFLKLPWRAKILEALLEYDLVGFQTMRDRRNFIQCLRYFRFPGLRVRGRGAVHKIEYAGRTRRVGTFPISIDFKDFENLASSPDVSKEGWYFHEALPERKIVLGVDRLDYTKGILNRLEAFQKLLEMHPDLNGKITLVQVVVPSRESVPEYQNLKNQIERLVGKINGLSTKPGWVPIQYFYRSLDRKELLAYYRAAEIGLVTPLRDGMNLVAKEYCACNIEENGVLILSEFAGAAAELQSGAILVNPYDVEGMARAIYDAYILDKDERRRRMKKMRRVIRSHDVYWWVEAFLEAAFSIHLADFPIIGEEPVPDRE